MEPEGLEEALKQMIAAGQLRTIYDPVARDLIVFIPSKSPVGTKTENN